MCKSSLLIGYWYRAASFWFHDHVDLIPQTDTDHRWRQSTWFTVYLHWYGFFRCKNDLTALNKPLPMAANLKSCLKRTTKVSGY